MAKNTPTEAPSLNTIGQGTIINGDIITNGDVRIDGQIKGKLQSSGRVIVGTTGQIEGEIECRNGDLSGQIDANVKVAELLILKTSVRLTGNITTGKLAVEPGAEFTGHCSMETQRNAPSK
ncbi:MAG TPA: cell shape determination protein CcmA [Bacteroidales bacterium]|nr:MAG: hypothetical protein A2X11_07915 [Bacteroidetes bacterium GWE2_42_24]OFY26440.1 MAG: hypothetical protein A2X09_02040 [Bacteroidetes bacterium GWF2_43_11]HAQ65634.1 cell shape determination protein CcmA [Bacteroidales bacterium]HBZ68161.1 cell shape determination protein CcmA [Bacteroidales bacterium]